MQKKILVIITSIISLSLFAQPRAKQNEIEQVLRSIDTLLISKNTFKSLYIAPETTPIDVEDINKWAADLQESEFSNWGLEVSSGYDYRFWDHNVIDDSYESGDIIHYKHRFLVSLKWNIMQSGLIGRDNFRQKVDILTRTKSQEVVNNTIKYLVIESAESQIGKLYGYYNILIDAKAELYNALIEMQDELFSNNKATMLSLSDLKIKRTNVLRMRKGAAGAASGVIDLDRYIRSQYLFEGGEYSTLLESNNSIVKNKLDQELIKNETDNVLYRREIKVSPYTRFSNYGDAEMNSKNVVNLGVTATFPIFTNTKAKRNEVISRGVLLANEEQIIRKDIAIKIEYLLQQLNENYTTLQVLIEGAKHYHESCELALQFYNNKTMTLQELTQRYIDNLDNNVEIYKLIIERETTKYSLYNAIYGL